MRTNKDSLLPALFPNDQLIRIHITLSVHSFYLSSRYFCELQTSEKESFTATVTVAVVKCRSPLLLPHMEDLLESQLEYKAAFMPQLELNVRVIVVNKVVRLLLHYNVNV